MVRLTARTMIAVALLVTAGATRAAAQANAGGGIAVSPGLLTFTEAQRGEAYGDAVLLFNNSPIDESYSLTADGTIAEWVSFHAIGDLATNIATITVPQRGSANFRVTVAVPAGTQNGTYEGDAVVQAKGTGGADTAGGVLLGATIGISVEVGGDQRVDGHLGSLTIQDAEVGQPVQVRAAVTNGGNVTLQPELHARFIRDGIEVGTATNATANVDAAVTNSVVITWDTKDALPGQYDVEVTGTARGLDLGAASGSFRLAQPEELVRSGELLTFAVVGETFVGGDAVLRAQFNNTSPLVVDGRLSAEVYHDGQLFDTEVSPAEPVPASSIKTFDVVIRRLERGEYRIVGAVDFDGRTTATREVTFTVGSSVAAEAGGSRSVTTGGSSPGAVVAGGLIAVLALLGGGFWYLRRHHAGRRTASSPAPASGTAA
jgi:hypothetical protein